MRDWTPPGLLERPVLKGRIDEVAAAWSAAWLAGLRLKVVRWEPPGEGPRAEPQAEGRSARRTLEVSAPARAMPRLLERALDAEISMAAASEADRRVLDAFAGRLLDDLLARLEAALLTGPAGLAARRDGGEVVRIGLGEGEGGALLWLAVPVPIVVSAARAALPPPRPRPAPARLASALGTQPVQLDAVLGRVRLGLAELRGLSVGDVLVLDRRLAEPAQLQLAGEGRAVAQANLIEVEGRMALDLQPDQS